MAFSAKDKELRGSWSLYMSRWQYVLQKDRLSKYCHRNTATSQVGHIPDKPPNTLSPRLTSRPYEKVQNWVFYSSLNSDLYAERKQKGKKQVKCKSFLFPHKSAVKVRVLYTHISMAHAITDVIHADLLGGFQQTPGMNQTPPPLFQIWSKPVRTVFFRP